MARKFNDIIDLGVRHQLTDCSQASSTFTMSAISQSLAVMPAAIAGVIFRV